MTIKEELDILNHVTLNNLKEFLKDQPFISCTSDMSTKGTRYFVLTGHFIYKNWEMKKFY